MRKRTRIIRAVQEIRTVVWLGVVRLAFSINQYLPIHRRFGDESNSFRVRGRIQNLPSGQVFKVVVTVGADGETGFAPVIIVEGDPIEIDENGKFMVRDFSVGSFTPGTYRVDILVLRAEQALADFNFISACEPAPFVTVR